MLGYRQATQRSRALVLLLPLLALLPAGLLVAGCADDPQEAQPIHADAGAPMTCVAGTLACACTDTGGCDRGLLCQAGRCYPTEGTRDEPPDPDVRPPLPPVMLPPVPPDAPDASTDSGPSSNG